MEIVIELLGEIFGDLAEWGVSSKAPKLLRYTLRTLYVIFAALLTYFMILWGISCLNENDVIWGCVCIGAGVLIVLALVIVIFAVVKKNKKTESGAFHE